MAGGARIHGVTPDPLAGRLFGWGRNYYGEVGLGDQEIYSSPVQVGSTKDWRIFTNFYYTSSGIRGGRLYRWGSGSNGVIGIGSIINYSSPVQIGAEADWAYVFGGAGSNSAGGLRGGRLFTWGYNPDGQLGLGDRTRRSSPVQVGAATDWVAGSVNDGTMLAIRGGKLFACGANSQGQLGLGNVTKRSSPVQVGAATDWTAVAIDVAAYGLRGGALYSWGYDGLYGLLGDGTSSARRSSPVQVGAATDWTDIVVSGDHVNALRGGMLFTWGRNGSGELGLGDRTDRWSPVQVGSETDWTSVSAGNGVSFGIRGGKLFAWGYGVNYQLGLGEAHGTISYSSPVQVGSDSDWKSVKSGELSAFALR